ncbi:MAG: prolyl oligopeptidase family serine peptidase [Actinobacteria bacterium]|nr:prolyl oligopeptidase family serine peptidase [Actinomycetota bacterium]
MDHAAPAAGGHITTEEIRLALPLARRADHDQVAPPSLAGTLYLPAEHAHRAAPPPGLIVGHGAGSRRGRHQGFCRIACDAGFAVLAIDFRGHGESTGDLDGPAENDIIAAAEWLRRDPRIDADRLCYRGSSMGGYYGVMAMASAEAGIAAAALVCPAGEQVLLEGLQRAECEEERRDLADRGLELRLDRPAMRKHLESHAILEAARWVHCPVLLLHARCDEVVPLARTLSLAEALSGPVDMWIRPGGDHSSMQGSDDLHRAVARWLALQVAT